MSADIAAIEAPVSRFCPVCDRPVEGFVEGPNGRLEARCPLCQALERHRFLALLLRWLTPVVGSASAVLDVAPQPQVRRILVQLVGDAYVGVDLLPGRQITAFGDLTRLPFRDACFDVLVCYHVLEHIPDDHAAMRELARVLAPGGIGLVQVPRRGRALTDEDPSASVEERVRRFGQEDHVRWYGSDFESRMLANGLHAWVLSPRDMLTDADIQRYALRPREVVWICRRRSTTSEPSDFRVRGLGRPPIGEPQWALDLRPPEGAPATPALSPQAQAAADRDAVRRLLEANPLGRVALRLRRLARRALPVSRR